MTMETMVQLRNLPATLLLALMLTLSCGHLQAEKVDFTQQIWPTIENRCIRCHKAPYTDEKGKLKEPKAGLRLDTAELIMKGGDDGAVIVPGKPDDSLFYTLVILDPDDDDVMPSKGDPVTAEEAELIKTWIEQGAEFGGFKEAPKTAHKPVIKKKIVSDFERLSAGVAPVDPKNLDAITGVGGLALTLAQNSNLLRVDFTQAPGDIDDSHLKVLTAVSAQLTELNLAGSKITDEGVKSLGAFKKLSRLHLENTAVGDAAVAALAGLDNLVYLNLYGTKVTDASAKSLEALKGLEKVYLWQTAMTDDAVLGLRKARPELMVSRGWARDHAKVADEAIVAKFLKGKCCDQAHQKGWACTRTCCMEAVAAGKACETCNPVAPPAEAPKAAADAKAADAPPAKTVAPAELAAKFKADSCCDKAHKAGKTCAHDCCVAAAVKNEVCTKCNPQG